MPSTIRTIVSIACLIAVGLPAGAVEPGSQAPSLTMTRLDDSKATVSIERLRGRVVYVDFWASWCIPCRISMPMLDNLHKKNSSRGFEVVGVNKDGSASDAERFLKRVPVGFTLVSDESDRVAKAFDVKTMPSGYVIDRKGIVRYVHGGFTRKTASDLEEEVEKLLAEKP